MIRRGEKQFKAKAIAQKNDFRGNGHQRVQLQCGEQIVIYS